MTLADDLEAWAEVTAHDALAETLPRRWEHVRAVAAKASRLRPLYGTDAGLLVAAAWLHDIGYSPQIVASGLHALDGARHLRKLLVAERLCGLVAHHSGAIHEAQLCRLTTELAEFEDERTPLRDGLWYCDMTTGPSGESLTFDERLSEIQHRYGMSHIVSQAVIAASPEIRRAVNSVLVLAESSNIVLTAD